MAKKLRYIVAFSEKGVFWVGFGVCLSACLFIALVLPPLTGISQSFGGHGHDGYLEIAENIARGNGFVFEPGGAPVLHRPPLYPLLLAPLTLLPRQLQRPSLILVQSAMVGVIALLVFRIGKYMFGISAARLAAVIFLINPWVYWNAKNPMTAIIQGFLFTLFVLLIGTELSGAFSGAGSTHHSKGSQVRSLTIGVTGAGLALSHGAMLATAAIVLFIIIMVGIVRRNRRLVVTAVMGGAIMVLLVGPWTYRNWLVFKRLVPVTSNYGAAYVHGLVHWNICGEGGRRPGESYEAAASRFLGIEGEESEHWQYWGLKDPELDGQFNKKFKEHIRTQPYLFLKKLLLNSVEYYFPILTYPFLAVKEFSLENLALTMFHLILWGLALAGMYRARGRGTFWSRTSPLLGAIILYGMWYLPFVTFIGHSLYTFGTIPFLSILAARGLVSRKRPVVYLSQTSAS